MKEILDDYETYGPLFLVDRSIMKNFEAIEKNNLKKIRILPKEANNANICAS
jgi:hypothetical protein